MGTRVRAANAGGITRSLMAAGFTNGKEHKASRGVVRGGWSTYTEGVVSEQEVTRTWRQQAYGTYRDGSQRKRTVADTTPTGYVTVGYQFRSSDSRDTPERRAKAAEVLGRAAEVLTGKGYEVEMKTGPGTDAMPYLSVCRKDENGEVVRW